MANQYKCILFHLFFIIAVINCHPQGKNKAPMSEIRKQVVQQAFQKLDKTGDGIITVADLRGVYDVTHHPGYVSGQETEESILTKFLNNFEKGSTVDGTVTMDEFVNYYGKLSADIPNDEYFVSMIRNAWKL